MNAVAARNPQSLRCFIALWPDPASLDALIRCRTDMRHADATRDVRWIGRDALHLTARFLGPIDNVQRERLVGALGELASWLPAIRTQRCALWPSRARPRLLVLELAPDPHLAALARGCEEAARALDVPPEKRAFRPHITLARLTAGDTLEPVRPLPGSIGFRSLALVASDLRAPGARYRTLSSVALPAVAG